MAQADELCYLAEAEGKRFEFNVPNAEEENLGPILALLGPAFEAPPATKVGNYDVKHGGSANKIQ